MAGSPLTKIRDSLRKLTLITVCLRSIGYSSRGQVQRGFSQVQPIVADTRSKQLIRFFKKYLSLLCKQLAGDSALA